jgi:hypothetical protein
MPLKIPTTSQTLPIPRLHRAVGAGTGLDYFLLDAALAVEPPAPTTTAPDRRRLLRVIEKRKTVISV